MTDLLIKAAKTKLKEWDTLSSDSKENTFKLGLRGLDRYCQYLLNRGNAIRKFGEEPVITWANFPIVAMDLNEENVQVSLRHHDYYDNGQELPAKLHDALYSLSEMVDLLSEQLLHAASKKP